MLSASHVFYYIYELSGNEKEKKKKTREKKRINT